jgi:lipoate-protein ligase B
MSERSLEVRRLGRVGYADALALQKRLESEVIAVRDREYLLLLEHPHTFTIGRRSKSDGVLATAEMLRKLGVEVFETDRGGRVTYHGLGQVVGYPIISLSPDREDVHRYVRDIEEVLIRTMADFGIEAFRIEGLTGVHTSEGKVAAIGVHIKRWVTTHGFALNVNTDLSYYNWIIACEGEPVTSMARLLDREIDMAEVEDRIVANFEAVFEYTPDRALVRQESEPGAVATGSDDLGLRNSDFGLEFCSNAKSPIPDPKSAIA